MNTNPPFPVETTNGRIRWLLVVLGFLSVALVVVWWPGCRQYPEVTSKESLTLMKLLYTACNTRNLEKLAQVEKGINQLNRENKITAEELRSFQKIIGLAKQGDWPQAERASLKFARDQVR